jgi:hypothetical protein
MGNMKCTPGPWEAYTEGETKQVVVGHRQICRISKCLGWGEGKYGGGGYIPVEEQEANAHLIAAAHELLEVVRSVFLWNLSKDIGRKKPAPLYPHIVEMARVALIKAEGGNEK